MSNPVDLWLQSNQEAKIESLILKPREYPNLKGTAIICTRGQAQAFFLNDNQKKSWILKKFLPGKEPELTYIRAIEGILPNHKCFQSGKKRFILSSTSLANDGYYSDTFSNWLEGSIMMPKIPGYDWAFWADTLREGRQDFDTEHRLLLVHQLSELIDILESSAVAHRDLSATNIMISEKDWSVHLIDWDCIYHSSQTMPKNTTLGTNGYISPLVLANNDDVSVTWCDKADRFSLAILNVELLLMSEDTPLTGDGGMFDQTDLNKRKGQFIDSILIMLDSKFPIAKDIFLKALNANSFSDCPSPKEWMAFSESAQGFKPPDLSDLYDPKEDFVNFLQKWKHIPPRPVSLVPAPDWSNTPIPKKKPNSLDQEMPNPDWSSLPKPKKSKNFSPNSSDLENPFKMNK